jgi:hypothetical protein
LVDNDSRHKILKHIQGKNRKDRTKKKISGKFEDEHLRRQINKQHNKLECKPLKSGRKENPKGRL